MLLWRRRLRRRRLRRLKLLLSSHSCLGTCHAQNAYSGVLELLGFCVLGLRNVWPEALGSYDMTSFFSSFLVNLFFSFSHQDQQANAFNLERPKLSARFQHFASWALVSSIPIPLGERCTRSGYEGSCTTVLYRFQTDILSARASSSSSFQHCQPGPRGSRAKFSGSLAYPSRTICNSARLSARASFLYFNTASLANASLANGGGV